MSARKLFLAGLAGGLLLGDHAKAAFLTDWSAPDVLSFTDPVDPFTVSDPLVPNPGGADIVGWMYRLDGGFHYFRLDVVSAPTTGNAAPEYSFQFDSGPGGASRVDTGYVPHVLTGIDEMLVAHFSDAAGVWTGAHRHTWTGGPGVTTEHFEVINGGAPNALGMPGSIFQSSENGGATLEWKIAVGNLGPISIYGGTWGATYDINKPFGGTFDLTETAIIPEPASLALLGLLGGVAALRRPRRQ